MLDDPPETPKRTPETPETTGCPVPGCPLCVVDGECEDCLDCLLGPGVSSEPPPDPSAPVSWGDRLPSRARELARARGSLAVSDVVGLVLREHRHRSGGSQRTLADELGLSKSGLGRAEQHPGRLTLDVAARLLAVAGYRLAVLDPDGIEVDPARWGVGELLVRDAAGRRLPAHADMLVACEDSGQVRARARYRR